jgi:hypothetical protein
MFRFIGSCESNKEGERTFAEVFGVDTLSVVDSTTLVKLRHEEVLMKILSLTNQPVGERLWSIHLYLVPDPLL